MWEFFKVIGICNLEDFIDVTNCVSLNDTYWVKEVESRVTWKTVSPYTNALNKVVSEYSFTGKIAGKCISGSPDFSTDGNFPKCWRRENGTLYLYKAGTRGYANAGNEPYSEVYAYKIAQALGVSCIPYTLGRYKNTLVSKCPCMCNENIGFKQYNVVTGEYSANFSKLLDDLRHNPKILDMLLLDYVTCNVDRHYGNFGYYIDNATQKVIDLAALYDHNLSCIPYYMTDTNLGFYISDICAKDGSTFDDLFRMIDCSYVRGKLRKLIGFDASIGCDRDKIVNDMVKLQVERALRLGKK